MNTISTPRQLLLSVGLALCFLGSASAGTIAANLSLAGDNEKATYVVASDANFLICSAFPDGRQAERIKLEDIQAISWREPEDWTAAWGLFVQHRFEEAAPAMAAVYENYKGLRTYEDSFSALAKFYQCESLRLSGKYKELTEAYEVLTEVALSAPYKAQVRLFNCWGHVGKELWSPLERIMEDYEVKEITAYTIPPSGMPFKKVTPREIIQIAYLRGMAKHKLLQGKRDKLAAMIAKNDERELPNIARMRAEISESETIALADYGRVLVVSYGDEKLITMNAMTNFLDLITTIEGFDTNFVLQTEAHAVAVLYRDLYGQGKVPSQYEALLTPLVQPEE